MEVVRAESAGACYGVQRALDIAHAVIESGERAYTLGSLIHNPQVVKELSERGAQVVETPEEVGEGVMIIRSHGVTPDVLKTAEALGVTMVDATCPHVARAQKAAAELAESGAHVIVVGEAGHPEVNGLTAFAREANPDAKIDVVPSPKELPDDLEDPVGVVVQTTQTRENLQSVMEALERRGVHPVLKDTICSATRRRQQEAANLASRVDAMVVIGGRNSSNTTRLAEICRAACPHTYHVESADELNPADFAQVERVGVTAGASTPEDQIASVISYLEAL